MIFNKSARFEELIRPHVDSAYNLARYLAHNDADAEDILQESLIRAFRFFETTQDLRPWFLKIARNCAYSWLKKQNRYQEMTDDEMNSLVDEQPIAEAQWLKEITVFEVRENILKLKAQFQEVLVLRELEQLSYAEISFITGIAQGTVMSRLARARKKFREFYEQAQREVSRDK